MAKLGANAFEIDGYGFYIISTHSEEMAGRPGWRGKAKVFSINDKNTLYYKFDCKVTKEKIIERVREDVENMKIREVMTS